MKKALCFILVCLLFPVCALAEIQRGDWGEEVTSRRERSRQGARSRLSGSALR